MEIKKKKINYLIKKNCLLCNNDFLTRVTCVERGHGKYCSVKCRIIYKRKERKNSKNKEFSYLFVGRY